MAALPAVEDSSMQADNWPQDDQSMGPGGNEQAANGASLPVDERSAGQDPENQDYPRGSSAGDNESYREKQVKVLRSFCLSLCARFGALSGFGIAMLYYSSSSHYHLTPFSCFLGSCSTLCSDYFLFLVSTLVFTFCCAAE